MTMNIEEFLQSLPEQNSRDLVFDYDYEKDDSDTSSIFRMQADKDVVGLVDFWKEKVKDTFFSLTHPTKPVITHAVYNTQFGMTNFVIMLDDDGNNPWVLAQCEFLINLVIVQGVVYKNCYGNMGPVFSQIKKLKKINAKDLCSNPKEFGFLLSQVRPYHFFYDHLKILKSFSSSKAVSSEDSFFFPKENYISHGYEGVFLFPAAVGNNYLSQKNNNYVRNINKNMEKDVYMESIEGCRGVIGGTKENYDLIIWLGVTGQKRSWLQQVEGYSEIVKKLNEEFGRIKVYVDGMTATDGNFLGNIEDEAVFFDIIKLLNGYEGVEVFSVVGKDYRTKICYCEEVDVFVANAGTGCMVPLRFNKKPGVLHSNTKLFSFPDDYPDTIRFVAKSFVRDDVDLSRPQPMFNSYHIPWQHIFNLVAEVINKVKGSRIKPLYAPPVKNVKKKYLSIREKEDRELDDFRVIEERVKPRFGSPEILREVALAFERSGDISTALIVMRKALLLRPTGPVIKNKVAEYQDYLTQGKG